MKFDPGKAWPHPVLRPRAYGDDYPRAEFQVEIGVERRQGSTSVEVSADFELSDSSLLDLLRQSKARYALLIKSPKTHCRLLLESYRSSIKQSFSAGQLSGRVSLAPFLICTNALPAFRSEGWHADFGQRTFDVPAGAVLAEDVDKEYWIDTADEAPLGSIFGHKPLDTVVDGHWEVELDQDRVWIVMSAADDARYEAARKRTNNQAEGQYLMNGLYLPALLSVLKDVDQNPAEYEGYRWFASLDQRLELVGCLPLGSPNSNRLADAQKILEHPFLKMPIIAQAETQGS